MKVKVKKSNGAWWGLIFGVLIFGFSIWGVNFSLEDGDRVLKLLLAVPIYLFFGLFIIVLIGAFNTYYIIDDKDIKIKWGFFTTIIPWANIHGIVNVKGASNIFPIFGVSWPGYIAGLYSAKGLATLKIFGTDITEGLLFLKTANGFFGLTPQDTELYKIIAEKSGIEVENVNMDEMSTEKKGTGLMEDVFYKLLFILNIVFILAFALYLAIFFPGSGAPNFIILLLVLAIGLFFFNISNSARLFSFSDLGSYILLSLGIAITGTFFILSLSAISL